MGRKTRSVIMLFTALSAAGMIVWLQGRYEAADERHALEVVQSYRSKAGQTIPNLLSRRHPGKDMTWSSAVESSCFQHIRVHALVADPPGNPVLYAFTVDINGPSIHPANNAGKELMVALDKPPPPPATSAAASASP